MAVVEVGMVVVAALVLLAAVAVVAVVLVVAVEQEDSAVAVVEVGVFVVAAQEWVVARVVVVVPQSVLLGLLVWQPSSSSASSATHPLVLPALRIAPVEVWQEERSVAGVEVVVAVVAVVVVPVGVVVAAVEAGVVVEREGPRFEEAVMTMGFVAELEAPQR